MNDDPQSTSDDAPLSLLAALREVNAAINSSLDLDQTLRTIAQMVAVWLNADLCAIFLFDDYSRLLEISATSEAPRQRVPHYSVALGEGYTGFVGSQGRPLRVTDLSDEDAVDKAHCAEARRYDPAARGLISAPIIYFMVEKLEGVINVQTREPRAFTDDDVAFLELVAGQLAMSMENARLFETTDEAIRRRYHELSTFYDVSAEVASSLSLKNVLANIAERSVLLSGADKSVLFEFDATTQRLRARAASGFDLSAIEGVTLPSGQCCAGRAVQSGESVTNIDCMRLDGDCFLRGLSEETLGSVRSTLSVPLTTTRNSLGALCVFSSQRQMLSDYQVRLVMTFANVAAIAMENARLFEETQSGLRRHEALLREMHHRVKNNLSQVVAVLNMQKRRATNEEVIEILNETVGRIQGIAAIHDLLTHGEVGLARVDDIARNIVGVVQSILIPPSQRITFEVGAAPYLLPTEQATTLAIVVNELIANAIEHGFAGLTAGEIRITAVESSGQVVLRLANDGVPLPERFNIERTNGLGLQLVRSLTKSGLSGAATMYTTIDDAQTYAAGALIAHVQEQEAEAPAITVSDDERRSWTVAELRFPANLARLGAPETARIEAERARRD
jgi:two-component sensor histidine kinase/putative methionine-R-sulfoxide reductase with GAF domain